MERKNIPALVTCKKCKRQFHSVEALVEHSRDKHGKSSASFGTSHFRRNASVAALLLVVIVAAWYFATSSTSSQPNSTVSPSNSNLSVELVAGSQPVLGDKNAPVTIVEFGDFQCPNCGAWFRTQEQQVVQKLITTGRAKLMWRDFDFWGPDSTYASEAAYAAGEQGKFWEFYDRLYSNQQTPNNGWASKDNLKQFAEQLGLNMTQFNQSFDSGKYETLISANFDLGKRAGVTGTPTFFLIGPNGKIVTIAGGQPESVFEQAVASMTSG